MTFIEFTKRAFSEAIFPGISSILSFFPMILLAVSILSLLHRTGIITPKIAPFIIGFSCSVPAILSCNTIQDKKSRLLTALLIPYMSCSAKLPVYMLLAATFFPAHPFFIIILLYSAGVFFAAFSFQAAKGTATPCSLPSSISVLSEIKACCVSFAAKAFTIIPAASLIIWLLMNLSPDFKFISNIETSLLAHLGRMCSPIFAPLGFGDWRAAAALLTGLSAKETIVSTFTVLAGTSEQNALCNMLGSIFTPASSFSFMVFCLFYMPCISTLTALRSISNNFLFPLLTAAGQTLLAWAISWISFHLFVILAH